MIFLVISAKTKTNYKYILFYFVILLPVCFIRFDAIAMENGKKQNNLGLTDKKLFHDYTFLEYCKPLCYTIHTYIMHYTISHYTKHHYAMHYAT